MATVEFTEVDAAPVVAAMRALEAAHDGWVNLQPGIHPGDVPPSPSGISALFAATSPSFSVPVATWVPGRAGRRGPRADMLGLQHGTGPRVVARLAAAGVVLPTGWRWRQDHPRRGLVVELPDGTGPEAVVAWVTSAVDALSLIPLTGDWRAEVHGPVGADLPEAGALPAAGAPGARGDRSGPGEDDTAAATPDTEDLHRRWDRLVARWDPDPDTSRALVEHLLRLYGAPRRAYHQVAHLRAVLDTLEAIAATPQDRYEDTGAVELAGWFHDAVLEPLSHDNEARSADLAAARLPALGVSAPVVDEVVRLVRLTETHQVADGDRNAAALMDADLAVLGGSPAEYERYRAAVRSEYAAVGDAEFQPARAAVLRALLERPLFHTTTLATREGQARGNVERELAELGA